MDFIQTFMLERTGLRGRIVRLGPVLDEILGPHNYPEEVSRLTAEAATLTALLASMLKFDGIFTLQAQGKGPVRMVVADLTSQGALRACATMNEAMAIEGRDLMGHGHLAFTVDQGPQTERYQGIVELKSGDLVESVQTYFRQSEQIRTGMKMAVAFRDGHWHARGILVQHMPEEGGYAAATTEEDDWRRTMILLQSCTEIELTDAGLTGEDLLIRLFHEEGVRIFEPLKLSKGCRCTAERLSGILSAMPEQDRRDMAEDGIITMNCQFCSRNFLFRAHEL